MDSVSRASGLGVGPGREKHLGLDAGILSEFSVIPWVCVVDVYMDMHDTAGGELGKCIWLTNFFSYFWEFKKTYVFLDSIIFADAISISLKINFLNNLSKNSIERT